MIIVIVKLSIVVLFVALGWHFINQANYHPYTVPATIPGHETLFKHGWGGVLGGAGIVFFAFIGFDAVWTAAQEAKNPSRDMPIGILGSLVVCTILYILVVGVLCGLVNYKFLNVRDALAVGIDKTGVGWGSLMLKIGALMGLSR